MRLPARAVCAAVVSLAVLLAGCGTSPVQARERKDDRELREKVDRISRDVERLRGLKFKRPVPIRKITQKEAAAFVRKALDEDCPGETFAAEVRAFKTLGLLPADYRMREELIGLLEVQAGGFYDPDSGRMLLVDQGFGETMTEVVLSHELTHALDDQHFDVKKLIDERTPTLDYEFVLTGLLEGVAMEVMTRYVMAKGVGIHELLGEATRPEIKASNEKVAASPPFVRRYLLSRYLYGMAFVSHFQDEGWDRIDAIYRELPLSAEQVMHPVKYYPRRDFPTRIDLPDISKRLEAGGWKRVATTTLGEINVMALAESWSELLKDKTLEDRAGRTAKGWDGDLLIRFENDAGESVTVWISNWDTPEDAEEMKTALEKWVRNREGLQTHKEFRRSAILEQPAEDGKPGLDVVCVLVRTRGRPPEWVTDLRKGYTRTVVRNHEALRRGG